MTQQTFEGRNRLLPTKINCKAHYMNIGNKVNDLQASAVVSAHGILNMNVKDVVTYQVCWGVNDENIRHHVKCKGV